MLAGQEEEVIAMYLGGATIVDIQEHFGCSDSPILRILNEAGIERRRGRPPGRTSQTPRHPIPYARHEPQPDYGNVRIPGPEPQPRGKIKVPSVGPRASKAVQDEVFRRDGYRCRTCGSRTRLTVEFSIPPEKGGSAKNPRDLRTVCAPCATRPVDEKKGFIKKLLGR